MYWNCISEFAVSVLYHKYLEFVNLQDTMNPQGIVLPFDWERVAKARNDPEPYFFIPRTTMKLPLP